MKISLAQAGRILAATASHPDVNLVLATGERRFISAVEALVRVSAFEKYKCQSRAGKLYKISEVLCTSVLGSVMI